MNASGWKPGDWVIYRKQKFSTSPGPRAKQVLPATQGETYSYFVEKFWVVADVLDDGQLLLRTRRGKNHTVTPDDPWLRRARWWERWLYGNRFRSIEAASGTTT